MKRGLAQTASKITGDLQSDFQNLGARMETIENKLDKTVAATNQNSDHIQTIQEQLDVALSKIDDLENRSRRYNIRMRGLPESITNVPAAVQDVIKNLIPYIPQHRLELDRAPQTPRAPQEGWHTERHCQTSLLCSEGHEIIMVHAQGAVPGSTNSDLRRSVPLHNAAQKITETVALGSDTKGH